MIYIFCVFFLLLVHDAAALSVSEPRSSRPSIARGKQVFYDTVGPMATLTSSMVGTKRMSGVSKKSKVKNTILDVLLDPGTDVAHFSSEIKTLAAKRPVLNRKESTVLFETALERMRDMGCEDISSCVWALGTLGCAPLKNNAKEDLFASYVNAAGRTARRGDLVRMLSGLSKMKYKWSEIPNELCRALMQVSAT